MCCFHRTNTVRSIVINDELNLNFCHHSFIHQLLRIKKRILVGQQRRYIELHTGGHVVVRDYTGETSRCGKVIDNWTTADWETEISEVEVMVFVPQLLRICLQRFRI